jgi:cell division protein FtsB
MRLKSKKNKIKQVLLKQLQLLVVVLLMAIIFVIIRGIYFRVQDERNISRGVEALQSDVEKFDQENKDLNKLVKYFNSVEFQEKEIKEKLNLVKEGEKIVFIQGNKTGQTKESLTDNQKINNITTIHSNYYYWWKYFFGR